jgi:hypothetical protein
MQCQPVKVLDVVSYHYLLMDDIAVHIAMLSYMVHVAFFTPTKASSTRTSAVDASYRKYQMQH